ncbi:hypothetical protein [Streptomyces antarcticus]|uniref:hypothetical protein n=1 Tax=Streptomyces antarcticus TaxID=2996458 RepID=UPI00227059DD|nr:MULTISPECIES: hypothetical protein [unclassified Streptomyces]MCY0942335.1 hypothetical protein [Streptomyces sp. H34-AA3]MCZ4080668.1 hypothetical protein [Streptomyces sp. H34-S5]
MGNLADESGTDVEIYRLAQNPNSIHVVSRSDAPEALLYLLDNAGLERHTEATTGPTDIWHETPEGLSEKAQKQTVTRAALPLMIANYNVNIDPDLLDVTAWAKAMAAHRAHQAEFKTASAPAAAPPGPASTPARSR